MNCILDEGSAIVYFIFIWFDGHSYSNWRIPLQEKVEIQFIKSFTIWMTLNEHLWNVLKNIIHTQMKWLLNKISYLSLELLWQAPELLKSTSTDDKDENKSKEGDIYSFGIILSEIITREDPYADYEMEPKG